MQLAATAIVVAAGSGTRLGHKVSKALVPVAGLPLVAWTVRTLERVAGIETIVVVVPPGVEGEHVAQAARDVAGAVVTVAGGARRRDSVRAGLDAVSSPLVLVHDAARPLASAELFGAVLDGAERFGAAIPGVPVADTLVRGREARVIDAVAREDVFAVQTPQGFRTEVLRHAHANADAAWDASDDGSMVRRAGGYVAIVAGERRNVKVTWPDDLVLVERWLVEEQGRDAR